MQVGDFLRVGSVGVVVIETHDGVENRVLSEEKIQKIMKDTTSQGGFMDLGETDGGTYLFILFVSLFLFCFYFIFASLIIISFVFIILFRKLGRFHGCRGHAEIRRGRRPRRKPRVLHVFR